MKMNKIRVSLNRECPCNSGEKYKKCCLEKDTKKYGGRIRIPA
jgi:uncharacterized protein YchJ